MEGQKVASISTTVTTTKPVKLRAACNACFAAKVRCEGNKSGCARCIEKSLSCVYSESRVGKVVGKRRKRPIDGSVGMINSEAWIVNNSYPPPSIPSPAHTNSSEGSNKRTCTDSSWTSLIADDAYENADEQFLKMSECRAFSLSSDMSLSGTNGLPTPALSPPPQFRFLSPMVLDKRPQSSQSSLTNSTSQMVPPHHLQFSSRTPEPQQTDDAEMVCIKLLAHVKRHSGQEETLDASLNLLRKTNATLSRMLRGKSVQKDYSCQMLLSSVMTRLVTLGEQSCKKCSKSSKEEDLVLQSTSPEQLNFETGSEFFEAQHHSALPQDDQKQALKAALQETLELCSILGDLLKRKPLQGFQALGRHEHLQLDLGRRLKVCLGTL